MREPLLSAALDWVKIGVPAIPATIYYDEEKAKWIKRPIVNTYAMWRDRPMTVEECEALPWDRANGIMLLTGIKAERGYFFAIDVDIPLEELRPSLGIFRVSYFEETISNRLHALYWSKAPVPTLTAHDDRNRELRLLGAGAQVVVAPSYGYKKLNDNPLSVIDDPLTYFSEICGRLDFRLDKEKTIEQIEPPPRLKKLLNEIVSRLKVENIGGQYISAHCPFHPPDEHPSFAIHKQKNYAIDYHDGHVYNLKELAEALGIRLEDEECLDPRPLSEIIASAPFIEYLSPPLLPRGALVVLAGKPGVGKSMLCLYIAHEVARGGALFGRFECRQGKVLLIDEENNPAQLKARIQSMALDISDNIYVSILRGFRIDVGKNIMRLEDIVGELGIDLVILDNWTCLVKKVDENKGVEVGHILNRLRRMANETNTCVLLVHHLRKDAPFPIHELDTLRGSSVLTGVPDIVLLLSHERGAENRVFKVIKNRYNSMEPAFLLDGKWRIVGELAASVEKNIEAAARAVKDYLAVKLEHMGSLHEILENLSGDFSESTIRRAIDFLYKTGQLEKPRRGFYRLPITLTTLD